MKEIKISFTISISLKQTDIHWIEEELLKRREEVVKEVLKKVLKEIGDYPLKLCKYTTPPKKFANIAKKAL